MAIHSPTKTVSAAGAARLLGFGKQLTLKLIRDGRLPAKQLDGRIRVRVIDCEKFVEALPDASHDGVQS